MRSKPNSIRSSPRQRGPSHVQGLGELTRRLRPSEELGGPQDLSYGTAPAVPNSRFEPKRPSFSINSCQRGWDGDKTRSRCSFSIRLMCFPFLSQISQGPVHAQPRRSPRRLSALATGAGLEPAPPAFADALTVELPRTAASPARGSGKLDMSPNWRQGGPPSMSPTWRHTEPCLRTLRMSPSWRQGVSKLETGFCFLGPLRRPGKTNGEPSHCAKSRVGGCVP